MSVDTIAPRARKRGLLASAIAWVWPQPLQTEDKRAGLWSSRVEDKAYGRRHGLMALLFGWMWPAGLDRSLQGWWRASWLWSWIWPGRVMGPDGEICPLAPWHAVVSPGAARRGRRLAMLATLALAAPTFMGANNILDGGRLNLLHGGAPAQEGGGQPGGDQATDPGAGGGAGGGVIGDDTKSRGGPFSDFKPTPGDSEGEPDGLVGGDGSGEPGLPDFGAESGDAGPTFFELPNGGGDDLAPDAGLIPGGGAGGGGGGGGGGQPTDPTDGDDPFTPPGSNPPGVNPPAIDPPGPLDPPTPPHGPGGPTPPGVNPPNHFNPDGPNEDPRGPGGDEDPIDNTGPRDDDPVGGVPEPSAWALMIMGFGAVGYAVRRRRFAANVG